VIAISVVKKGMSGKKLQALPFAASRKYIDAASHSVARQAAPIVMREWRRLELVGRVHAQVKPKPRLASASLSFLPGEALVKILVG
jgi:hypothetical protein